MAIIDNFQTKMFKYETTSLKISKNIGHPTSGSKGKKTFKWYLKSEHTDGQTHRRTNTQTDISTYRKHRPRGPMLWKEKQLNYNIVLCCPNKAMTVSFGREVQLHPAYSKRENTWSFMYRAIQFVIIIGWFQSYNNITRFFLNSL